MRAGYGLRRGCRNLLVFAALVALLQPLMTLRAYAWWNGDWPYRVKITADAGPKGAAVTEPIGRTQILLRLHSGNFNFSTVKEDGADLRFVAADDKTPLKFHIARFDGLVDQVALVWIDVPDLAPGAESSFFMYWGNNNAPAGGDPRATYDPDQLLVYHFGDENGLPKDLTGFANNALTGGKRDESGITGFALRLDGKSPVRIPASPSLAISAGQSMTWSMWFRPDDGIATAALYSIREGQSAVTIGLDSGVAYAEIASAAATQRTSAGPAISSGSWHLLTVTAGDKLDVYVDGTLRGESPATLPAFNGMSLLGGAVPAPVVAPAPLPEPTPALPQPVTKGKQTAPLTTPALTALPIEPAAPAAITPPNFAGLIGDFEISKVMRPLGALQIAVKNQGPEAKLLTLGAPEQTSTFGSGYIGIILGSVTADAWVVIGILGVMFVSSWVVMVGRAVFLSGQRRANAAFRAVFTEAMSRAEDTASPLTPIRADAKPILRRSPLFRIYQIAEAELRERLRLGRVDADGALIPQSLSAIRTAMDAAFVMERQRLSNLMVLLTIAIAGGPFIGLLGTVIGVMITFAAIAAAGDVNVNAIAPGISAALLATVAGLAVAIPALFGYNYFTTRIRDISTEMQIFLEDLVARMAEGVRTRRRPQAAE